MFLYKRQRKVYIEVEGRLKGLVPQLKSMVVAKTQVKQIGNDRYLLHPLGRISQNSAVIVSSYDTSATLLPVFRPEHHTTQPLLPCRAIFERVGLRCYGPAHDDSNYHAVGDCVGVDCRQYVYHELYYGHDFLFRYLEGATLSGPPTCLPPYYSPLIPASRHYNRTF